MKEMKFEYPIEGGDFVKAGHASSSIKKILNQLSTLSKVGEQEYETAIAEFDNIVHRIQIQKKRSMQRSMH